MRSQRYTVIISLIILLLALLFDLHQQGLLKTPQKALMQRAWLRRLAFSRPNPTPQPTSLISTSIKSSATMSSNVKPASDDQPLKPSNGQPIGLPQPSHEDASHKLDLSSGQGSISMDNLGPLVVNKDGTLSRISNWEQMTEIERKNTLRILGKRNQLRTGDLKAKEVEAEIGQGK